jgi:hypothetical protein
MNRQLSGQENATKLIKEVRESIPTVWQREGKPVNNNKEKAKPPKSTYHDEMEII